MSRDDLANLPSCRAVLQRTFLAGVTIELANYEIFVVIIHSQNDILTVVHGGLLSALLRHYPNATISILRASILDPQGRPSLFMPSPGYESDELEIGKSRNTRNLRKTQNLAGLKRNRYVDHGDHDDHELATIWLQLAFRCKQKIRPWMVASGRGLAFARKVRCKALPFSITRMKLDLAAFH